MFIDLKSKFLICLLVLPLSPCSAEFQLLLKCDFVKGLVSNLSNYNDLCDEACLVRCAMVDFIENWKYSHVRYVQ